MNGSVGLFTLCTHLALLTVKIIQYCAFVNRAKRGPVVTQSFGTLSLRLSVTTERVQQQPHEVLNKVALYSVEITYVNFYFPSLHDMLNDYFKMETTTVQYFQLYK